MSNVAVASTVLAATELTIRWNKIRSVNSLLSAGQTIPLFLGIGTVVRILYVFRFFEPTDDDRRPYLRPIGPTIVPLQAVHPPIDRFPRQERMPLPARVDAIPLPGRMPRRH